MSELRHNHDRNHVAAVVEPAAIFGLLPNPAERFQRWRNLAEKAPAERGDAAKQGVDLTALNRDVLSLADRKLTAEEKVEFQDFMNRMMRRPIADGEKSGTLLQVFRLLSCENAAVSKADCILLARLVLQNAACPNRIDQGQHNTCNVTALETRCYTLYPSVAAALVADVAIRGEFVTADGSRIRLASLEKDFESRNYKIDSGSRNFASQLFQLTAVNIFWNRQELTPDGKNAGKGNIIFAQENSSATSTGEYILNKGVSPPQRFTLKNGDTDGPQLDVEELVDINTQIVGKAEEDLILERHSSARKRGITSVDSAADLRRTLTRLKEEKRFPVVLIVDASMPPFSSGNNQASSYARHAVTVTDFDPKSDQVSVDNQYGAASDLTGAVGQKPRAGVEELYAAMRDRPPFGQVFESLKKNLSKMDFDDFCRASRASATMTAFYACAFRTAPEAGMTLAEQRLISILARDQQLIQRRFVEQRLERLVAFDRANALAVDAESRLLALRAGAAQRRAIPLLRAETTVARAMSESLPASGLKGAERQAPSSLGWRLTSTVAAAALVVGVTDLGKAYNEGTEYGVGVTGRVLFASIGYETGFGITAELLTKCGTKNLPARVVLPVTVGVACATAYDTALGENFERLFRTGYRRAREYVRNSSISDDLRVGQESQRAYAFLNAPVRLAR